MIGFIAETIGDNESARDFVYMINIEIYGSQDTPLNTFVETKLGLEKALKRKAHRLVRR